MNREEPRPTPVEPEALSSLLRFITFEDMGTGRARPMYVTANGILQEMPARLRGDAWKVRAALARLAVEPDGLPLDPHRFGGLIERAIRQSKRESGGLLPDGWTLVEMALAYPPQTPTEPSMPTPAPPEARE